MGSGARVAPVEASDASANAVRRVGSDVLTRRTKLAVFDLATRPAGLTKDSGASVDHSGTLAAHWVILDPLRALVSPAAMFDLLGFWAGGYGDVRQGLS